MNTVTQKMKFRQQKIQDCHFLSVTALFLSNTLVICFFFGFFLSLQTSYILFSGHFFRSALKEYLLQYRLSIQKTNLHGIRKDKLYRQ